MSDNVHSLKKPIKAHGEEINELTFREPGGKDVKTHGFPFTIGNNGQMVLNGAVVCAYISALADIPPSSVDDLHPTDINLIGWRIAGFFLDA